jgi:hypothetical protein
MLLLNRYKGQQYDVKNPSLHIIQKEIYFCIELHKDKLRTFKKKKKNRVAATAALNILLDKKCRETPGRVTGSSELY